MKNLILAALAGFVVLQACNNDKKATTESTTDKDTTTGKTAATDHSKMNDMNMNNDLMNAMKPSMEQAEAMKMTGDFDYDFASMMIYHHQGAIDMSQVALSKGSDPLVKGWAQKIIDAQKAEISQFQQFTTGNKPVEMKHEGGEQHNEMHEIHEKTAKIMNSMTMTGNVDKDFVMMMKVHHEAAVEMAQNEVSHGKKYDMKKMAQKIIEDQNKEIKEFNDWLAKNK
ncbi:hypothetical protein CAP36_11950 [Chitinophagaceae bacterium IBVUCB2]|nr:hypothetical protein CAP36_11950 [Chitinophagaceae bacterium IBVUCB2]